MLAVQDDQSKAHTPQIKLTYTVCWTISKLSRNVGQIFAFNREYQFSVISANIIISNTVQKARLFWIYMNLTLINLMQLDSKPTGLH